MVQYIDEYIKFFSSNFSEDRRFGFSIQRAADWGGDRVKDMSEELIDNDFYKELLIKMTKYENKLNISPHGALMNGDTCVCYANKRYSFVVGSDATIYKCTADFVFPENIIGYLDNGKMIIDNNLHAKWLCSGRRNYNGCSDCYFSGACMSASCPASFIKGEKDDLCLFEKSFIDYFLPLFDRSYFTEI